MQDLVLLHGAIGSSEQLEPLAHQLGNEFRVHNLDFPGHGGSPLPPVFSIDSFANSVLEQLDRLQLETTDIFGYSMGGYVGMYLAVHYPHRIGKLVTLGTKFHWDETVAAAEVKMLQPEKIEQKLPRFAEQLAKRHAPVNWKRILEETASMLVQMGRSNPMTTGDQAKVEAACLLMLGDQDKMVGLKETVGVYEALPKADLAILPGTPHPVEQVEPDLLSFMIRRFLKKG